jgi:hypothetical protein
MHCDFVSDFCPLAMSTEQSKMLRTNNDTFSAHCEVPPRVGNSLSLHNPRRVPQVLPVLYNWAAIN